MNNSELPEFLTCQQVRAVDRFAIDQLGIDGLVLMENAARGCVDLLESQPVQGGIVIVCGKGNNGGDGLVMARHCLIREIPVKVILLGDPKQLAGDARRNYEILIRIAPNSVVQAAATPDEMCRQLAEVNGKSPAWIVDAMLGTGTQGEIRDPFRSMIELINDSGVKVFSVDIPSGMNGDTGERLGVSISADVTATFVSKKSGFQNSQVKSELGELHVLDIGVPDSVVQKAISECG